MSKKRTGPSRAAKAKRDKSRPKWNWILVALILLFIALIRIRLLEFPLERDEGEYAYAGQLILQGVPPYQLAYNMKLPGTYAAYALILALFGQTHTAVHWGLLLVNAATIVLVYLLGARLFGRVAGVAACASYALLSASQSVLGLAGHATHFVVLPALAGLLLLLKGVESEHVWNFFWSGLLVGAAFIMKQPGVVFMLFAGLFFLYTEWRRSPFGWRGLLARGSALMLGAVLPFGITCLVLYRSGVFARFWFWTFSYGREYASRLSLADGFRVFLKNAPEVIGPSLWIWLLAAAGITAFGWRSDVRIHAPFVIGLFLFSFLGVCPGFYFRQHYFILMLPAAALLAGLAVSAAREHLAQRPALVSWRAAPAVLFLAVLGYTVLEQKELFFQLDPRTACRLTYGANPFPESLEIAKYLKDHSTANAQSAVIGSEPQIYFYSGRRSATGYIYTYGLMEEQRYALRMQKEMIAEIEQSRPEYLVFVDISASWLARPDSEKLIFTWFEQYARNQYDLDGMIDILGMDRTEYRWGEEARDYQPRSQARLQVFKRKIL